MKIHVRFAIAALTAITALSLAACGDKPAAGYQAASRASISPRGTAGRLPRYCRRCAVAASWLGRWSSPSPPTPSRQA